MPNIEKFLKLLNLQINISDLFIMWNITNELHHNTLFINDIIEYVHDNTNIQIFTNQYDIQ